MGLKMQYISDDGVEHPDCYFRVVQTNFCHSEKNGKVDIYGYHSEQERIDEKQPVVSRSYVVGESEYNTFFADDKIKPADKSILDRAYSMIKTAKEQLKSGYQEINGEYYLDADVVDGEPKEGAIPVSESEAKESFFVDALDV